MPRISYIPDGKSHPATTAAIRARRGGMLLKMDRIMLHSQPYAEGWNDFLGTVISKLSISSKVSQLIMYLVGVINGAEYETFSHGPKFLAEGGTQAQIDALQDFESAARNSALFDEQERAAIQLTIEMTRDIKVSDETFEAARAAFRNEEALVDLVGTIAAYSMVARFVVALEILPDNGSL